jgi:acylphosphatase
MTRYTVHFEGRVQGVGFRFTTSHLARHYNVTGYVQNLPDGRVLLVTEGEREQVQGLVDAVRQEMGRYINNATVKESDATCEFGDPTRAESFGVRH